MVKAEARKQKVKVAAKKAVKKKGGKTGRKKDNSTSCDGPAVTLSSDWPMATEMPRVLPADSKLTSEPSLLMKFKKDDSDEDGDEDFCFGGDHAETEHLTSDAAANKNKSAYEIESPLAPGPCLRACSGADVQLARGANTKPNLDKAKGKFLIILPGMMSFQHLTKSNTTKPTSIVTQESSLTQETCLTQESSNMVEMTQDTVNNEEEMEDGTIGNAEEDSKSAKAAVATKSALPKLGKIENLGTDNPILKIPFDEESNTDNDKGRVLVFSGKKIDSSSKFMVLTCNSRKQSVTCKDIYSSVIVFGEGKWEKEADTDMQSDMVTSSEQVHEKSQLSVIDESAPPSPLEDTTQFKHYGGSNRAVDGGKAISSSRRKSRFTSHKRKSGEGVQINLHKPIEAKKADEEQRNDSDSESEDLEIVLGGDDEDDDEYVTPAISKLSQDSTSRKQTPRRSAAKTKVNYTDMLKDSDSDKEEELSENENDDEDKSEISGQSNRPKRGRQTRKSNSSTARKQPKKNNKVVEIDDDDSSPEARPTRAKAAVPKAKTVARTKKTPAKRSVVEIDELEDDSLDESSTTGSARRKTTASRKQTPRRSAAKTKVNYTDMLKDSDSDMEDELSENKNDDEDKSETSGQSNRPKRGRPTRKSNASTARKQPKKDNEVVEIDDDDDDSSPEARPTRAKAAVPKAKTVARTKKTPAKRSVVEIDELEDDGSDESSTTGYARRKTTPRRSVTKTKVNYAVVGSDDENDQDGGTGEEEQNSDQDKASVSKKPGSTRKSASPNTASSARKKPAPRKSRAGSNTNKMNQVQGTKKARAASKKNDQIDIVDDDTTNGDASLEHDENSSPKDRNNANMQKVKSTRKTPVRRQTKASTKATDIIAVKMGNKGKPLTSKNIVEDVHENQEVGVNLVSSPTETPKSKSSRRKRKSPGKALKSPTKKKLLVNDDEFSFLD